MWICLLVEGLSGAKLQNQVTMLFEGPYYDDILEVPYDDEMGEKYVFVKCLDKIRDLNMQYCSGIKKVLPNHHNPNILSDNDVSEFAESYFSLSRKDVYMGDVVFIKKGLYRNFTGVVSDVKDSKILVYFRLFSKDFRKWINRDDLEVMDNFFRYFRFPVLQ